MRGMRLRFTIRDLLWLVLLMAVALGWWLDHRSLVSRPAKVVVIEKPIAIPQVIPHRDEAKGSDEEMDKLMKQILRDSIVHHAHQ